MEQLDGIDAVLSDRLRELGMDYVADVMEGKRQPSQSQAMFLSTGRTYPRREQEGTLLIGGASDGERVRANPEQMPRLAVPRPMQRSWVYSTTAPSVPFTIDSYNSERMRCNDQQFWFYVHGELSVEQAFEMLFQNYESPNAVYG